MFEWLDSLKDKYKDFSTPISIERDKDYPQKLEERMQLLTSTLTAVNADKKYIEESTHYTSALMDILETYFKGYTDSAQQKMDRIIGEFQDDNIAISNINNSISFGFNTIDVQFYRARKSEEFIDFPKKEMLHIPFSQRSKVRTERFGVPGLPCLYLGTTSYVCWLELGCPPDHQFNVSSVTLDNSQRILNLAVNFVDFCNIADNYENCDENTIITMLRLLILSIATSFKVKDKNRVFKSEYILSHLVMISCLKKGLSGVSYYSKQIENDNYASLVCVNLALFAIYNGEEELSELCDHIKISDSFNYAMYKNLWSTLKYRRVDLRIDNDIRIQNIISSNRQYRYRETDFYGFDQFLFCQHEDKVKKK